MSYNNNGQDTNAYSEQYNQLYTGDEEFESLNLDMDDDMLNKMLIQSLESDRAHWNQAPWKLSEADEDYTGFLLGDQLDSRDFLKNDIKYKNNKLFQAVRAILSYATGQLARPEITPSKSDQIYLKAARDIQASLYQHASDNDVDLIVRATVMNLVTVKRAYIKLRFDPNIGTDGDIVTEMVPPEDIIIDRTAGYLKNPNKIYHRLRCSIDELVGKFPDKKDAIFNAFGIKQGRFSQLSREITYFECAFTYMVSETDSRGKGRMVPKEGIAWFIPEKKLILDKMKNPNWIYKGSRKEEKEANITDIPPKGIIAFNYFNLGKSFIDETSLVEQAIPLQRIINKRGRQIMENADYVNGRYVASKKAMSEDDARAIVNKGARTVAMVNSDDVNKSFANIGSAALPQYVENTLVDSRNELDQTMGTPSIFKGAAPGQSDTLGRDLLLKQQAGALQDDLVGAVAKGMKEYYRVLLQMMRVYYTEDHWFEVKGGDGKYQFILLNGDKIDSNVKVSVQVDSTLPLDKAQVRATAMELWKAGNAIDYQTFMEDLGLPNPEERTERYLKQQLDPTKFLRSIEMQQINTDAESDIQLLIAGKTPEERDEYDMDYINYFNKIVGSNRFAKMGVNEKGETNQKGVEAQQRITAFLMAVQHVAQQSLGLQQVVLDAAEQIPFTSPMPTNQPPMGVPGQPSPTDPSAGIPGQTDPNAQVPPTGPQGTPVAPPQAPPSSPAVLT